MAGVNANKPSGPLIEPSDEEKRNGWTAETLTAYLNQQHAAQGVRVDIHSDERRQGRRPVMANNRYNPLRWRG